jgi:ABC-type sugar transport system ATPase subunit
MTELDGHTSWFQAEGLTKAYGPTRAADGLGLAVTTGEVHGLIGPNGAGKSTLVKMIAGVVSPDAGIIRLDGERVSFDTPTVAQDRGIVMMPQEISVVNDRDLVDNVTLGSESVRWGLRNGRECRRRTERELEAVGLELDPSTLAGSLSAAEQRMLMLARALDRKVRLLILDEPTAGMSPRQADLVMATVRRLADRGVTVLYVSHHLSEVASICHRVTCVREGQLRATFERGQVTRDALLDLMVDPVVHDVHDLVDTPASAGSAVRLEEGVALSRVEGRQLAGVTFTAHRGEVTGVTGLLGSGVSEVVAIVTGKARATSGELRVGGRSVALRSPAAALERGIGFASGDRGRVALPRLSVGDNVAISALRLWFGRLGVLSRSREHARTEPNLRRFSVRASPSQPLSTLSGGNQQRVLMARLVAADAQVLVLEEPTVGVDINARHQIWEAIRSLAADRTVIVASSEPEELAAVSDHVVCLRHGSVSATLHGAAISEGSIARAIA